MYEWACVLIWMVVKTEILSQRREEKTTYIHAQHCTYSIKMSVFEKAISKNWWIPGKANPEFNIGICVLFTIFNPLHDKNVYFAQIPQPCTYIWLGLFELCFECVEKNYSIWFVSLEWWSSDFFCLHCWIEHSKTIHVNDSTNWNQNIWLSDGH